MRAFNDSSTEINLSITEANSSELKHLQYQQPAHNSAYSDATPVSTLLDSEDFCNQALSSVDAFSGTTSISLTVDYQQSSNDSMNNYQQVAVTDPPTSADSFDFDNHNIYSSASQAPQSLGHSCSSASNQMTFNLNHSSNELPYLPMFNNNNLNVGDLISNGLPITDYDNTILPSTSMVFSSMGKMMPRNPLSYPYNYQDDGGYSLIRQPDLVDPYEGIIREANVLFCDEPDKVSRGWSMTEKCQSRRLVRFWSEHYVQRNGSQSNDLLKCGYHIQEDSSDYYAQPNDPLLVSCIYWKAVDKYFITSVDYIRLLEGLLRVRYTFQEKNRVRRNLSAFSNITIKNNDPKTVDFYKLIMSYSNPKPRNIDKDIKAFEWYTVPYAITKVINRFKATHLSIIL